MTNGTGHHLTDEELLERVELVKELGSASAAARALGVAESSVRRSLQTATRRNLTGEWLGKKLQPGYTMGKVTVQIDRDGNVEREWQRRHPTFEEIEAGLEEMVAAMGRLVEPVALVPAPVETLNQLLAVYPVVDVHLGLYAWAKETGENYDLDIARDQFQRVVQELVWVTPQADTALIVVLGDFFHADNNNAVTERSGNHLDVDGRHDKVLHLGAELIIWMIDLALQKHWHVVVKVMRGNHDPYASKALAAILWFRYALQSDRVTIDRSPMDLWAFEWGVNMLAFTHGDNVRAEDMPGTMAALEPEMWGRTKFRFGFSGHYHKSKKGGQVGDEKYGAEWEILPAFTAKDAWTRSMGHASKRVLKAITFHKTAGRKMTFDANI